MQQQLKVCTSFRQYHRSSELPKLLLGYLIGLRNQQAKDQETVLYVPSADASFIRSFRIPAEKRLFPDKTNDQAQSIPTGRLLQFQLRRLVHWVTSLEKSATRPALFVQYQGDKVRSPEIQFPSRR